MPRAIAPETTKILFSWLNSISLAFLERRL
jgi:hypothetical protein